MKRLILCAAIAGAFASNSALAGPLATLSGWGVNTTTINGADNVAASNYTPTTGGITYVSEDSVGGGGLVGPNYGGQRYDLEGLYVKQIGTTLQIAGITGARWNDRPTTDGAVLSSSPGYTFGIGDLFIGGRAPASTNGNTFSGYGIELTGAFYTMNSSGFTTGAVQQTLGAVYSVSPGAGYSDGLASSRAGDSKTTPGQLVNPGIVGGDGYSDGTAESAATLVNGLLATVAWEQMSGNRHSAFLVTIDLATLLPDLMSDFGGNLLVHWGEVCANDYLEVTHRYVPEPGSLALMALGLFSLGALRRRREARM